MHKKPTEHAINVIAEALWDQISNASSNHNWDWCVKHDPEYAHKLREKAKSTIEKAKLFSKDDSIDFSFKNALLVGNK